VRFAPNFVIFAFFVVIDSILVVAALPQIPSLWLACLFIPDRRYDWE